MDKKITSKIESHSGTEPRKNQERTLFLDPRGLGFHNMCVCVCVCVCVYNVWSREKCKT